MSGRILRRRPVSRKPGANAHAFKQWILAHFAVVVDKAACGQFVANDGGRPRFFEVFRDDRGLIAGSTWVGPPLDAQEGQNGAADERRAVA